MASILAYAREHGYAAQTSTHIEAWRLSIQGLSKPLLDALGSNRDTLELSCEEDYIRDPIAAFGILEAKKHRRRGVSIALFLGLFKYYRQSYLDLLDQAAFIAEEKIWATTYLHRFFDRIELGFCSEWTTDNDAARVTELQAANRIMTNEKNKYLTLFESISQPVILLDASGILDRINQAAAQWLQTTDNRFYSIDAIDAINSSLQGKKYDVLFPWLRGFLEKLEGNRMVVTEQRSIVHNQQQLKIEVLGSPMCDVSRKFNGYVLVLFDRTQEYALISELQNMHFQLLQSSKLESLGQLAAGIAQEINTPSQFVNSNIEFLKLAFTQMQTSISSLVTAADTGNLSPYLLWSALDEADWPYFEAEIPVALQQSREWMARVTSIVEGMMEFSHPGIKEFEQVDINYLIELTANLARNVWKGCAELMLDLNPELPVVTALANEIGLVLLNLLINAAHAITEKLSQNPDGNPGRITIKTGMTDSFVIISIADTGCGIPEPIRTKVFDPFFTTKTVDQGTGQGLAIAYDVVTRKHTGSLDFETVVGEGTTFFIRLPIKQERQLDRGKDLSCN